MKLEFELVPDGCWGSNLRTALPKEAWAVIRKSVLKRANGICSVCGAKSSRLEAHEGWDYDAERGVQKLRDIVALCPLCHSVVHIGRTQLVGDIKRAEEHFMRVNEVSYSEYRKALGEANKRHQELNKVGEWRLDISALNEII